MLDTIRKFLHLEAASAILLLVGTALAMILVNSPAHGYYDALLNLRAAVSLGELSIDKPLLLWINDGLMALFFFLVGLEIKREVMEGELSSPAQIVLPAVAAVGGMAVPALFYAAVNWGDPATLRGWAIPSATDIAFALGVLSLLGRRVPVALKLFLLTLAIIDDLGAIVIIALFYTAELSTPSFVAAGIILSALVLLKLFRVTRTTAYLVLGFALWAAVLKSGVHATIAGVVAALFVPLRSQNPEEPSPLRRLEEDLHHTVAFGVLPLFAFANAGVSLSGLSPAALLGPVPLGVALGLVLGKPIGVLLFSWPLIRFGFARMPGGVSWGAFAGVAMLCGIGFTMSLFIGSLAFEESGPGALSYRLGILVGSGISAIAGLTVLALTLPRTAATDDPPARAEAAAP
ncbi:MAG: Na+/H+ antiporter NhaA [Gammaproteobacteria bacterium]|jgi:NhaA family Na+:H+ antiporter|nr:Na+/H+ antiporter NhaA [Gammaproteobacteria bacterium]